MPNPPARPRIAADIRLALCTYIYASAAITMPSARAGRLWRSRREAGAEDEMAAEVTVVGAGIGGLPAAITAAQSGARVRLLERRNA